MEIIKTIPDMQKRANELRNEGKRIGLVPTMGALHEGHISLFKIARPLCDVLITSIFVNPTQFGENEDLEIYPRDFEGDEKKCKSAGVDIIFYPSTDEMYPEGYTTFVEVKGLSEIMCGRTRPNHFKGVATVVAKLFNIVKPHLSVFGNKDYQQAVIIEKMVEDLNFDVEIIRAPIVRESDGLAMSSRNAYLKDDERRQALYIYRALKRAEEIIKGGERDIDVIIEEIRETIESNSDMKIDYIEIRDAGNLGELEVLEGEILISIACFVGEKTRLIDNITLRV